MWTKVVLGILYACVVTISANFDIDPDNGIRLLKAIDEDDVFVISFRKIKPKLSYTPPEPEVLLKLTFFGNPISHLTLKLNRNSQRVLIELEHDGRTLVEGWAIREGILDDNIISKMMLEVRQDLYGTKFTLVLDCEDHGTVAITKRLKDILDSSKKSSSDSKYRNGELRRVIDHPMYVDSPETLQSLDEKEGCGVRKKNIAKRSQNNIDSRFKDLELTPSRRSDLPVTNECDDNMLMRQIQDLMALIKRLQQELEAQRAETRALRDYIERCNICRTGEDYRQ